MLTYFREIASGFWSLLAGMAVTIRYFVKPVVTVSVPPPEDRDEPCLSRLSPLYSSTPRPRRIAASPARCAPASAPPSSSRSLGSSCRGPSRRCPTLTSTSTYYCSLCGLCLEVCPTTALEYSREYRLAGFRREDAVIDHLTLLQERQQAAGLPITPIPTAAEIAAAEAAEAAAREAREKEAAAKAAQAKAAKPVQPPEEAKPPKAEPEPEEVKE